MHYHNLKQREMKFKPRIKLNHNISTLKMILFQLGFLSTRSKEFRYRNSSVKNLQNPYLELNDSEAIYSVRLKNDGLISAIP